MIARLCLSAIAAGLLLCGPSAAQLPTSTPSGSPSGQSAPVAGGNQSQAADDKKGATPGVPVLNAAKPPQDQEGGRNHANAQDGVGAGEHQQANNEDKLVNLTFWLVIATLFLMAATIGLWWETRKLAAQAKEASKDTKRSIEVAEKAAAETAKAAQAAVDALHNDRAWVTPGPLRHDLSIKPRDPDGKEFDESIGFAMDWENTGRTPALRIGVGIYHAVLPIEQPFNISQELPLPETSRGAILGPGRTSTSVFKWVAGDEFKLFKSGARKIIIVSSVAYSTTTNPKENYTTKICLEVRYGGEGIDAFGVVKPIFRIDLVGNFPMM